MDFGDELKRIRESRGMTVNQLAMYSEVSSATISRVENKKRGIPKPKYIRKLAEALKYPFADLMRLAGYSDSDKTNEPSIEETEMERMKREIAEITYKAKNEEDVRSILRIVEKALKE